MNFHIRVLLYKIFGLSRGVGQLLVQYFAAEDGTIEFSGDKHCEVGTGINLSISVIFLAIGQLVFSFLDFYLDFLIIRVVRMKTGIRQISFTQSTCFFHLGFF